jgi:hypothetical protein
MLRTFRPICGAQQEKCLHTASWWLGDEPESRTIPHNSFVRTDLDPLARHNCKTSIAGSTPAAASNFFPRMCAKEPLDYLGTGGCRAASGKCSPSTGGARRRRR